MPSFFEVTRRYNAKIRQAHNFAEGAQGPAWNGLFLMGLAMAGLTLIPTSSVLGKEFWWITAPSPLPDPERPDWLDWEPSWIAEENAFRTAVTTTEAPDHGLAHLFRGTPEDWTGSPGRTAQPDPGEPG